MDTTHSRTGKVSVKSVLTLNSLVETCSVCGDLRVSVGTVNEHVSAGHVAMRKRKFVAEADGDRLGWLGEFNEENKVY